jgi:hypothetical protein
MSIPPSSFFTSAQVMERPRPVPCRSVPCFVVKNGSKIFFSTAHSRPVVLDVDDHRPSLPCRVATRICPPRSTASIASFRMSRTIELDALVEKLRSR